MATVRMMISKSDKPSEEQLKQVRDSKDKPIAFDEDSPQMTQDMLDKFRRVNSQNNAAAK